MFIVSAIFKVKSCQTMSATLFSETIFSTLYTLYLWHRVAGILNFPERRKFEDKTEKREMGIYCSKLSDTVACKRT